MTEFDKTLHQLEESFLKGTKDYLKKKYESFLKKRGIETKQERLAREKKNREEARVKIHGQFKKLKDLMNKMNYTIHKSKNDTLFTTYEPREVHLTTKQRRDPYKRPNNEPKYRSLFFGMVHEVGHTLQWIEGSDRKIKFDYFFKKWMDLEPYPMHQFRLDDVEKIYYEFHAWDVGTQFVPEDMREEYKRYSKLYLDLYIQEYEALWDTRIGLFEEPLVAEYMRDYGYGM